MPMYEYECAKCGRYDVSQRITEPALTKCDRCGSREVQRLISRTAFTLKGGGWYREGYSSGSQTKSKSKGSAGSKNSSAA